MFGAQFQLFLLVMWVVSLVCRKLCNKSLRTLLSWLVASFTRVRVSIRVKVNFVERLEVQSLQDKKGSSLGFELPYQVIH